MFSGSVNYWRGSLLPRLLDGPRCHALSRLKVTRRGIGLPDGFAAGVPATCGSVHRDARGRKVFLHSASDILVLHGPRESSPAAIRQLHVLEIVGHYSRFPVAWL